MTTEFAAGQLHEAEGIIESLILMAAEPGQSPRDKAISKARKDLLIPLYRAIQSMDRDELFAVTKVSIEAVAIITVTLNPSEKFIEMQMKEVRRQIDDGVRVKAEAMMKAGVNNVRAH